MVPLALLGAGNFLKSNWKIIAIGLAVIAAFFWFQNVKKQAYNRGKADADKVWVKKIQDADARARVREKLLQDQLNAYGERFAKEEQERLEREDKLQSTIRDLINRDPNSKLCRADPKILIERNKIRELGPE